ncbi:MAG: AAA domain-containing protein, partial [Acidimicrobiales bacterium]
QVLMVGDPGQISPVVTGDTSRWAHYRAAPHRPAPQALMAVAGDDVTHLRLPATCRLGPVTTALIQPLYGFGFASTRPPRAYLAPGSDRPEPEVALRSVVSHGGADDPALADAVAARVREVLGGVVRDADGDERPLGQSDVAVICAHVSQVTAVQARLGSEFPGVMIDTTERHQGLEHEVVVLWLPLAGARGLSAFALDTGRLCVGLSRHRCHLSIVTRHDTRAVLDAAGPDADAEATRRYQAVLDAIAALG